MTNDTPTESTPCIAQLIEEACAKAHARGGEPDPIRGGWVEPEPVVEAEPHATRRRKALGRVREGAAKERGIE